MTNEELQKRLEAVTRPDMVLEEHRRELKSTLLARYESMRFEKRSNALPGKPTSFLFRWRTALVTSAVWLAVIVTLFLSVIMPGFQSGSAAAKAINAVLANSEIRSILSDEDLQNVSISDIKNDTVEVIVESRGGTILIVAIEIQGSQTAITDISYVIMFGSIYQPEQEITGSDLDGILDIAASDTVFEKLTGNDARTAKAVAVDCLISTRHLETNKVTEVKETWAMLTLEYQNESWYFLVDPVHERVINRNNRSVTD